MKARAFLWRTVGCVTWYLAWPVVFMMIGIPSGQAYWFTNLVIGIASVAVVSLFAWLTKATFLGFFWDPYCRLKREDQEDEARHRDYITAEYRRLTGDEEEAS